MSKLLYSRREAAELLSCKLQNVNDAIVAGALPAVKLGGRSLIHRRDLLAFADKLASGALQAVQLSV